MIQGFRKWKSTLTFLYKNGFIQIFLLGEKNLGSFFRLTLAANMAGLKGVGTEGLKIDDFGNQKQ